jgi:hypothetical protein
MKTLSIILFLFSTSAFSSEWTTENKILEVTYNTVRLADILITKDGMHREGYHENNPLIGRHPSDAKLWGFFLVGGVIHYFITDRIKPEYRRTFQAITITCELLIVNHNRSIGMNIKF